jgi:hypothetical protein
MPGTGFQFSAAGADNGINKQNNPAPAATSQANEAPKTPVDDKSLDYAYVDERTVTIARVQDYSLYRRVNSKALLEQVSYIGSSVTSSRTLAGNKDEIAAYFPNLIGVSANNENFFTRVKQYLNNIMVKVDKNGKTFNISFRYNTKRDYLHFKEEEDKINAEYDATPRNDIIALRRALQLKINRLNALESEKHKYGIPIDVEDYLMYRHCLLYNDVAKDPAFVNIDSNVRFYFRDDAKEAANAERKRNAINKAKANYVTCIGDNTVFEAVYIQYALAKNLPVMPSLAENKLIKESNLDRFSTEEPELFNRIFNDGDKLIKATIEKLIARGELIRLQHNQNITTATGEFIGSNISEAVVWFKNPDNTSAVNAFKAKLNLI